MVKKFLLDKVSRTKQIYIDLFGNIGIGIGHKWSKYKPKRTSETSESHLLSLANLSPDV